MAMKMSVRLAIRSLAGLVALGRQRPSLRLSADIPSCYRPPRSELGPWAGYPGTPAASRPFPSPPGEPYEAGRKPFCSSFFHPKP